MDQYQRCWQIKIDNVSWLKRQSPAGRSVEARRTLRSAEELVMYLDTGHFICLGLEMADVHAATPKSLVSRLGGMTAGCRGLCNRLGKRVVSSHSPYRCLVFSLCSAFHQVGSGMLHSTRLPGHFLPCFCAHRSPSIETCRVWRLMEQQCSSLNDGEI